MDDAWLNRVLYTLLVIVAYLFYGELRRAWDLRQQALWDDRYIEAVRSSPEEWRFGWRLEDLESRLHVQRRWAEALHGALDARGADDGTAAEHVADGLAAATSDVAAFVTLDCAARPGRVVHVGPDEFRDMSDRCHAFSGLDVDAAPDVGPQAIFEVVHLDGDEGSVGLRALSNGKFARVKAPPAGAEWNAPWIVEFASPLAGLALCANQIFNPTSMCAYSNVLTRALPPCFENSLRAIDSSKNQPNRLRFDRAREFSSLAPTSQLTV
jgi:hypothetical protein